MNRGALNRNHGQGTYLAALYGELLSSYPLTTFKLPSDYILAILWLLSGYSPTTFWLLFHYFLVTL